MEALGITAAAADRDYKGIDQEQAQRLQAIQKRTELYYEKYKKEHEKKEPGSEAGKHDDTGKEKSGSG
ncbi:hypothetical protein [Streptomyces sp. XD-27]|uniref:hypothetical protein n=1 Tax=Streptomyces sp. XD-27 TaxID=3062779 RepID=UPI0026F426CB|nr:hypothetical protein [Streptomyces sp. XD-27]WKX72910.1 hypothetical protein Q3Y56_26120 [Streptomyces sp. XD-27]